MNILCSIYDRAASAFSDPFVAPTENAARRMFAGTVLNPETRIHQSPSDFALYLVGQWDNQTGEFTASVDGHKLMEALEAFSLLPAIDQIREALQAVSQQHNDGEKS